MNNTILHYFLFVLSIQERCFWGCFGPLLYFFLQPQNGGPTEPRGRCPHLRTTLELCSPNSKAPAVLQIEEDCWNHHRCTLRAISYHFSCGLRINVRDMTPLRVVLQTAIIVCVNKYECKQQSKIILNYTTVVLLWLALL